MKAIKLVLVLLALGIASNPSRAAQDDSKDTAAVQDGRKEGRGRGMPTADARIAELDRNLALTADQKTKLSEIFAKSRDEMQSIRGEAGDRGAKGKQMRQMMQSTREQVQSVLTDEQKKKFEEMERPGRGGPRGERPRGAPGKRKKNGE